MNTTVKKFRVHDEFRRDAGSNISLVNAPTRKNHAKPSIAIPKVAVLLCTHNGERFLTEQLDSIRNQDYQNISIWVSDDASQDRTSEILKSYQHQFDDVSFSLRSGPNKGFATNFLSLLCDEEIQADYFAFSDQDDIWEPSKLSHAIQELKKISADIPALYCSRTQLIDKDGKKIGYSPIFKRPPSFANALVQNIGGGNTMVMNKAAREILMAAGEVSVVSHDWWAYMLITGAGGIVIYNPEPTIRYRQHGANLVGSNTSWRDRWYRIQMLLKGRSRDWNTLNTQVLIQMEHLLTTENKHILTNFCAARNQRLLTRTKSVWKSGIYRQTLIGNIRMTIEIFLKKI